MNKPLNYWDYEKCKEVALLCKYRNDFKKQYPSAYDKCIKNGWLDDLCSHMEQKLKPAGYWTKEKCHEISLTCETRMDFKYKYSTAYDKSVKNEWLDEICSHMKPTKNKYTIDTCRDIALLCESRTEFKEKYPYVHRISSKNNWLDDICSHMITTQKPNGYWTIDRCRELAILCVSRKDFENKYESAYKKAQVNKWLDEICSHMEQKTKPFGFWTKEECHKVALLCQTMPIFRSNYVTAYEKSYKNKWLDEICSHMIAIQKPKNYYTFEKCKELALLFNYRSDFENEYYIAYNKARKKKWLDEICSHMSKKVLNTAKRIIYMYKFDDNSVYIGLTCNIKNRNNDHLRDKDSSVYKHIKLTDTKPELTLLTEFLEPEEAANMEIYYIDYYRKLNFNILNKVAGGAIGGSFMIEWSYEKCKEEAKKYIGRQDFRRYKERAYLTSIKNNWLDEFYPKK